MRHTLVLSAMVLLFAASAAVAGQPKLDVCHKGHTINVALPSVPAHVAHGDIACSCAVIDECAAAGKVVDEDCGCVCAPDVVEQCAAQGGELDPESCVCAIPPELALGYCVCVDDAGNVRDGIVIPCVDRMVCEGAIADRCTFFCAQLGMQVQSAACRPCL